MINNEKVPGFLTHLTDAYLTFRGQRSVSRRGKGTGTDSVVDAHLTFADSDQ